VKYKDEVTFEHVNTFMDYSSKAVDLANRIYDRFYEKTGRELANVEVWLSMASGYVARMIRAASGQRVTPDLVNNPLDCMKCVEVSLYEIEDNL
jgi:hypothetical protein